jgi:membrane peptidoglycan carboxypeptidase
MMDLKVRLHASSWIGVLGNIRLREIRAGDGARRFVRWFWWLLIFSIVAAPVFYELRTSALQSWILSRYARKMFYKVGPGPSPSIVFPKHGPFDIRAGYALIPEFQRRLEAIGYQVIQQARFSPELERVARWGILPPYSEPNSTQLVIQGMDGQPLFQAPVAGYYFDSFEDIPPLAVKTLLLIENRELDEPSDSRTNPVVDWDRLAKAAILYAGHKLGLPVPIEGGSTLATQMEKYRHSGEGRTNSIMAKLRQMTDASLKVYQNGPDTREERRQIILDYLNSIPLAAAPGYGELHGIGNGLHAWFGLDLQQVQKALSSPDSDPEKARVFKDVTALLCSVKGPSYYLIQNHAALESRVNFYVQLLTKVQVITPDFARQVQATPIAFSVHPPKYSLPSYAERKAINEIRAKLVNLLGVPGLYELDRLHVNVESTINPNLQHSVISLFEKLHDPQFVDAAGLRGERLLAKGDPTKVIYGMMLYERSPDGNLLRVVTDNLNAPFDINTGMKMQLGSTAKLRTLCNYLIIASSLYDQISGMDAQTLQKQAESARDPITSWAFETLSQQKGLTLDEFLQLALDRKYSANPGETFFTGGGIHSFHNFEKSENGRIYTVREALIYSVNLAYIRLMRDLVRYYEARLPYDTDAVLADMDNPTRHKLLREISDEESKYFLYQAYKAFQKRTPDEVVSELLGKNARSERHLSILFYAWNHGADEDALGQWLEKYLGRVTPELTEKMAKAYGNPRLDLSDYGYLLGIHPLKVWCAGEMVRDSSIEWEQLWNDSDEARQISSAWLFKTRNRPAQDLRLRIRFEQDAFTRMTPQWKRLGFPFDRLVPSYATAIGSSGDRPEALAQLMGILVNGGVLKPTIRMSQLHFAQNTPYETVMKPAASVGRRVMPEAVSRAILPVLAQVVERGTAVRLAGAYKLGNQPLVVGGKTGSGDNRFDAVGRHGWVISSRPIDRTAVFVFYIGDRYFGVLTAFVPGKEAGEYGFTSSLPAAIMRLLAPDIENTWPQPKHTAPQAVMMASNPTAPKTQAPKLLKNSDISQLKELPKTELIATAEPESGAPPPEAWDLDEQSLQNDASPSDPASMISLDPSLQPDPVRSR